MYYVYMLLCSDKKYYVGLTNDIKNRILSRKAGKSFSTKYRLPVKLKWVGIFSTKKAVSYERYLKSGSGNAQLRKRLV